MTSLSPIRLLPLFAALLLAGCHTISSFDQVSYDKTTAAKADAVLLMDKATEPYSSHEDEVAAVLKTVEHAYQYDFGRPLNRITIEQWKILKAPEGNLFGGFIRRWREKGTLKPAYIQEKKLDIEEAFDQITQLEIGKPKSTAAATSGSN